jgi:molybdopterin synthase sulfur carrier subunit
MKLKLVYFAWIRDKIGKAEEVVEVDQAVKTIADLVNWLRTHSDVYADAFTDMSTVRCAINLDYVIADAVLSEGDEVGFFPPVTGG